MGQSNGFSMSLKIALILSVILQFVTAFIALTLVKRTRTNIAWWLISGGFLLMAIRRLFELIQVFAPANHIADGLLNSWIGVVISIVMLLSLSFIKRIFNLQKSFDELQRKNEGKIFAAIIRTEEQQKQQFSKELHDGLGPLLSSVKMAISAVVDRPDEKKSQAILNNAELLIDESIGTVKEISNHLSPHVLNHFGLHRALKSFIQKLPLDQNPKITLNSDIESKRFSYTIETVAYRVLCELITNTFKHARAQNVFVDVFHQDNVLSIRYLDDGQGFDFDSSQVETNGFGLTNIQSRIKSVQGDCQIFSRPGEGFNVNILINTP